MRTAAYQNRPHYPALDGLRGIAILLVLFYHNFGFINYSFFGWLGVDLFFVLSGFLITDILLRTKNSSHFLRKFYIKRILRIFPLYYLTLIIFFVLIPIFTSDILNLEYYIRNQIWFWLYLQNWLFIFHPKAINAILLNHLWSLAVEEQFYMLWPFLIIAFRKPKPLIYILACLLVAVITFRYIIWTFQIEKLAYLNLYTFSRIDGLCIGSMLAIIRSVNRNVINRYFTVIVLSLAVLNFIFYFFNRQNDFFYPYLAIAGYTTFAIIFGLLVNEGIEKQDTIINKLLSLPLFRFLGAISYSLYIFHWPLYWVSSPLLKNWSIHNLKFINSSFFASLVATAFSVLLGWISFHFFEKRFLKLKEKFN